jgi:magnesium-transporting ATPase (P-type)
MEKPEPDVMKRPPRRRNQPLLDSGLLWRAFWLGMMEAALCLAGFLSIFVLSGHADEIGLSFLAPLAELISFRLSLSFEQAMIVAATVYHAGVVTSQVGNAFACRSDHMRSSNLGWLSNKYLWLGILIEVMGIVSIVQVPFLANIFNHSRLPAWMWAGIALNAPVLYSMEWIRKAIVRGLRNIGNGKTSTLSLQEANR